MSSNTVDPPEAEEGLVRELLSKQPATREKAWTNVYTTCYPSVRDYVNKNSGGDQDSTDIFQDAMLILHHNLETGKFREESTLKTYLFSICKNLWLKELSKRQKQLVSFSEITSNSTEETGYLINIEIVTLLLNELRSDCRHILVEFYFNSKSMAELKDIFNVNSIQAAKNKKWRCLGYLQQLFKERGVSPLEKL